MKTQHFLLLKLMEECSEVAQRASKTIQFGYDEVQEGQDKTNRERLHAELDDLVSMIHILNSATGLGYVFKKAAVAQAKSNKLQKFYKYSQQLGEFPPC